jgi:hypothetical protein
LNYLLAYNELLSVECKSPNYNNNNNNNYSGGGDLKNHKKSTMDDVLRKLSLRVSSESGGGTNNSSEDGKSTSSHQNRHHHQQLSSSGQQGINLENSIHGLAPLVGDEKILENEPKLSAMIDQLQKRREQIFSTNKSPNLSLHPSGGQLPSPPQHHQHSAKVSSKAKQHELKAVEAFQSQLHQQNVLGQGGANHGGGGEVQKSEYSPGNNHQPGIESNLTNGCKTSNAPTLITKRSSSDRVLSDVPSSSSRIRRSP